MLCHMTRKSETSNHYIYFFTTSAGTQATVCQAFFLRTLGYSSNQCLVSLKHSRCDVGDNFAKPDYRGKHPPHHILDPIVIDEMGAYIESYNPQISHYRRQHAPNRRYLSPDISIAQMHKDFAKDTNHSVHYETFRKYIQKKNISFTKQGTLNCDQCLAFEEHEHRFPDYDPDCETCVSQMSHIENKEQSRKEYTKDKMKDNNEHEVIVSADMQKVMLLPYMTGNKLCAFTSRLVCFHETFAPLGDQKQKTGKQQVRAVLWHEAIAGRSAAEVTSVFVTALGDLVEDAPNVVIWMDNCSSQNKNWYLFTTMVRVLNGVNSLAGLQSVTFKYLETGHTFLSCDSFHGLVERRMRKLGKMFNFHDLESAIQTAGGGPKTIPLEYTDFTKWDKRVTGGKSVTIPKLKDIQVARFEASSKLLQYKRSHEDDTPFISVDFLMKKTQKEIDDGVVQPAKICQPRGIPQWKKDGILKLNIIQRKRQFWDTLPVNDVSLDLSGRRDPESDQE